MRLDASSKAIIALALSSFCMGVAEFIIAGVLPDIQKYFSIDAAKAGWLTTSYALGVVIGAPFATIPLSHLHRKTQLLINLFLFALANVIVFVSTDFYLTAIARFISGIQHGVFFLIATMVAIQVAKEGKVNFALSLMASGLTIALVSGVPLGAFVAYYFGFKAVFVLVFVFTLVALAAVVAFVPNGLSSTPTKLSYLKEVVKSPPMLESFMITACVCGAGISIYTYITEILIHITQMEIGLITLALLCYGICGIVGNLIGGKLTDLKGTLSALRWISGAQLCVFVFALFVMEDVYWSFVVLCLLGGVSFAGIAPLKMLAMLKAKKYVKSYQDSAISLNEASFNVGIALASFLGGIALKYFGALFVFGSAILVLFPALLCIWLKKEI